MDKAQKLSQFLERWQACQKCTLHRERLQLVHWRGNPEAKLMIVGEAPGKDEDIQGKPFVGVAGRKEDRLLLGAGIDPERDVIIVNTVACRPPKNRMPEPDEVCACSPRFQGILEIVEPSVLLLLGATAVRRLTGASPISRWRGHVLVADFWLPNKGPREIPAVATFHPSYLLRQGDPPHLRKLMIEDRKLAKGLSDG